MLNAEENIQLFMSDNDSFQLLQADHTFTRNV